ncbi:MAG: hypothetical protein NVV68_10075 [Dokdonella sp.]|nr:hypothetical protein [Dokdonella sp.]
MTLTLDPADAGAVLRLSAGDHATQLMLTVPHAAWRLQHAAALGVSFAPSVP